jgi:hypothetical protein
MKDLFSANTKTPQRIYAVVISETRVNRHEHAMAHVSRALD